MADELYGQAIKLIQGGLPQRASTLLDLGMATIPDDPRLVTLDQKAAERIREAEQKAVDAREAVETNPTEARELAESALRIDKENVVAQEVLKSLTTPIQKLKDRWDAFFDDYLKPLQDLALPFLYVLAALLILARLTSAIPWRWFTTSTRFRHGCWFGGLALAVVASALLTLGVAEWHDWPVVVGGLIGFAAVLLIACAMATRLRLNIEVRGKDGKVNEAATGQVIALLAELGAAPPSGLEVPRGADVTTLDGTPIAGTPETRLVAALVRVWGLIFGSTPWRVRVDEESGDVHSVVITRNGHATASAVIDRDQLGLRTPIAEEADGSQKAKEADAADIPHLPDLHRFSAAAILTELASHYKGFEGLLGVEDWRSLGLHYVATTDYAGKANAVARKTALAQAIDYDPRNIPAMVALRSHQDRESQDKGVLDDYVKWLLETSRDAGLKKNACALRLRVLMTLVATACNRRALEAAEPGQVALGMEDQIKAGDSLMERLDDQPRKARKKPSCEAQALVRAMQPSAAAAYLSLGGKTQRPLAYKWLQPTNLFSPKAHYNYACLLAREHPAALMVAKPPDFRQGARDNPGEYTYAVTNGGSETIPRDTVIKFTDTGIGAVTDLTLTAELVPDGTVTHTVPAAPGQKNTPKKPIVEALPLMPCNPAEAVKHLRLASTAPELRAWTATDPWLEDLRDTEDYRKYRKELLEGVRSDFLSLEALGKYAEALRAVGLESAQHLATASEWDLSKYLKVDRLIADYIVQLAQLADGIPGSLSAFRVEIIAALLKQGIDSPARLRERLPGPGSAADLAGNLLDEIESRCRETPSADDLGTWLAGLVPPGA